MGYKRSIENPDTIEAIKELNEAINRLFNEEKHLQFLDQVREFHIISNQLNQQMERFKADLDLRDMRLFGAIQKLRIQFELKKISRLGKKKTRDASCPSSSFDP